MRLPELPYGIPRNRREIVAMRGINYSDNYQDGDLSASEGVSTRRWPYLSTREARARMTGYDGVTALTAWEKLIAVKGTSLLYDGRPVGTVTAGEKQFAVVNTKLVIWPDKVYLDMDSLTVKPLTAKALGTGAVFTETTMTVSGWPDLTTLFRVGDSVTISGCTAVTANNKDIIIQGVAASVLTVAEKGFSAGTETGTVTVERRVPDLDHICASDNRLWGCSNEARTIYASALGDPSNFFIYEGLSTDSYAVAVGSEGDFTGCCKLSSSILFWKETTLHKLLGSSPRDYALYDYNVEGLKAGCHKSLQVVNEILYYMGIHGVYAYNGAAPALMSYVFGRHSYAEGVGGSDGENYFLSAKEGDTPHFLVYDIRRGLWLREDDTDCVDFARIGKDIYFLTTDGEVWLADAGVDDPAIQWSTTLCPFYETIDGRKRYSKLLLRVELPKGAWLRAEVRRDLGPWREAGKLIGSEHDTAAIQIAIGRCDRFEVRLSGVGPCTVLSICREFSVGSDR